jgi:hypothetical protein
VKPVVTKPQASSSKPQVEQEDKKPEKATKSKTDKPVASIFAKPVAKKEEKMEEEYRESPDHDQEEGEEELDDEEEEEQEGKAAVKL